MRMVWDDAAGRWFNSCAAVDARHPISVTITQMFSHRSGRALSSPLFAKSLSQAPDMVACPFSIRAASKARPSRHEPKSAFWRGDRLPEMICIRRKKFSAVGHNNNDFLNRHYATVSAQSRVKQ